MWSIVKVCCAKDGADELVWGVRRKEGMQWMQIQRNTKANQLMFDQYKKE